MSRHATRQFEPTGFSTRLKEARTGATLTQEQAARKLDVTLRTYQRWESGEGEPRGEQLARVCLLYGRPVGWFYEENGEAA